MLALLMDKTFKTALRVRENHTTAPLARRKCTPSAYGTSPGGGGLLYLSLSANLICSIYSIAKTSPSGVHSEHILKERQRRAKCSESFLHGKACHWILRSRGSPTNPVPLPTFRWKWCAAPIGVQFQRAAGPVCLFFPFAPRARLFGFIIRGVLYELKDAHHRRASGAVKPKNLPAKGRSILRTFPPYAKNISE